MMTNQVPNSIPKWNDDQLGPQIDPQVNDDQLGPQIDPQVKWWPIRSPIRSPSEMMTN